MLRAIQGMTTEEILLVIAFIIFGSIAACFFMIA
jgi:hypothetical protein